MITNIVASIVVCIVTNVTTTDNSVRTFPQYINTVVTPAVYQPDILPWQDGWLSGSSIEPTEKTEVTEVVEETVLTFEWEGDQYSAKRKRILSRTERKLILKKEWVPNE